MIFFKVVPMILLALTVRAEKKIELQDIEEDNLKSEKEKDYDPQSRSQTSGPGTGSAVQGLVPLEFLKSGIFKYFENPTQNSQPQRYVHQYAVTEAPENAPNLQYGPPASQQAMVGYLSNVPMQIYLVPQYYNEPEQVSNAHPTAPYPSRISPYQTSPEAVQTQTNYVEVPAYVPQSGKYVQQYSNTPVTYVNYSPQPTIPPVQPTVAPVLTYQMPLVQYSTALIAPQSAPKSTYYQNTRYTETNAVEELPSNNEDNPKQYSQTGIVYQKSPSLEIPRYYQPRIPAVFRHSHITELPPPNPLILKHPPHHLSHIPKALPVYRPQTKPVYAQGGLVPVPFTQRPHEPYGPPYKRRPTSLLDSYIPSNVQLEYLKRGLAKDPVDAYEALSSGRHLQQSPVTRHYERGFLPNQMYHTAAGGITYGHLKRTAQKMDKLQHK